MSDLLFPKRKVIKPPYKNINEVMSAVDLTNEHGIDMFCDLTLTNKHGKIEGKKSFECHSFVSNFIKLMAISFKGGWGHEIVATDISGEAWTGEELINNSGSSEVNWYAKSVLSGGHMSTWIGPIIGVGSTAVSPNDYWLEKPLLHGSAVLDLTPVGPVSGHTGAGTITSDATSSLDDSARSWSTDEWRHYLCRMTSGSASGRRFYIYDNDGNTLYFASVGGSATPDFHQYTNDRNVGDSYQILTYGQVIYGDTSFTTPSTQGSDTVILSISRDFTNNQGALLTVHEFGLQCKYYTSTIDAVTPYTNAADYLIVRDVDSVGVDVQDSEKLTLTYRIITVV